MILGTLRALQEPATTHFLVDRVLEEKFDGLFPVDFAILPLSYI